MLTKTRFQPDEVAAEKPNCTATYSEFLGLGPAAFHGSTDRPSKFSRIHGSMRIHSGLDPQLVWSRNHAKKSNALHNHVRARNRTPMPTILILSSTAHQFQLVASMSEEPEAETMSEAPESSVSTSESGPSSRGSLVEKSSTTAKVWKHFKVYQYENLIAN